jgi:hypothetical protein
MNVQMLSSGEHISDVVVWNNEENVCAVQFVTTRRRISPHYGGHGGTPAILNSEGGVLVSISGRLRRSDGKDFVRRLQVINFLLLLQGVTEPKFQAVWRHDVSQTKHNACEKYSQYIGGAGGSPFNDWSFLGGSYSAYISRVDIKCAHEIDGIQVSLSD